MATAETRRKEESAKSQDASPGQRTKARRSTRQLDFFQAMHDFKEMFPTLDDEVIEAVLRANDGAVDATIDQLLTMTIDEGLTDCDLPMGGREMIMPKMPKYVQDDDPEADACIDSPPSYHEAVKHAGPQDSPSNIWTTPIRALPLPGNRNRLSLDVADNTEMAPGGATGGFSQLSPTGLPSRSLGMSSPIRETGTGIGAHRTSVSELTTRKKEFRNWNPPMLGNLPDDFLRIMSPEQPSTTSASSDFERLSNLTTTPVNVTSLTDARPKVHKSRSKSEKVSRSASMGTKDAKEKDVKSKHSSERKSKSGDKMVRSFTVADDTSRSKGARQKSRHLSPNHHSVIIETHDFSQNMLEERMKENERRRQRTSADMDPERAQYLEDEQLALALQNSEFLQDLRGNKDFMKTLQRESSSNGNLHSPSTPVPMPTPSPAPSPAVTSSPRRPPDDFNQGYGDDSDKTLDAFPFSQPKDKDDDAELRQQLKSMGKASRKQLASLAKKFFRRKKKNSKQILGQKLAPSTLNLLEDDDDEEEEDEPRNTDGRYGNSPTEIEPLPMTLGTVPSHRTVQRPMYKPEGVTTYFDNSTVDMV